MHWMSDRRISRELLQKVLGDAEAKHDELVAVAAQSTDSVTAVLYLAGDERHTVKTGGEGLTPQETAFCEFVSAQQAGVLLEGDAAEFTVDVCDEGVGCDAEFLAGYHSNWWKDRLAAPCVSSGALRDGLPCSSAAYLRL